MKRKIKILIAVIIGAFILDGILFYPITIKPGCFFAGDQWGRQGVNFFADPNGELREVSYTVSSDPNSPDWGTWQRRFLEFQQKKTVR